MKKLNSSLALIFFILISQVLFSAPSLQKTSPEDMLKDLMNQNATMDIIINKSNVYNQYQENDEGIVCVHRLENLHYQLTAHPDAEHMLNPDRQANMEQHLFDNFFALTQNKDYHQAVLFRYYIMNNLYKQATVYRLSPQDICLAISNKYNY